MCSPTMRPRSERAPRCAASAPPFAAALLPIRCWSEPMRLSFEGGRGRTGVESSPRDSPLLLRVTPREEEAAEEAAEQEVVEEAEEVAETEDEEE